MSAPTDPALHVALQRHPNVVELLRLCPTALPRRIASSARGRTEMRSCVSGRHRSRRSGSVTMPTSPRQPCTGTSTVVCTSIAPPRAHSSSSSTKQEVVARPRARDQRHPAVAVPVGQRRQYHRTQRGQSDSAGDDHQIAARPPRRGPTWCRTVRAIPMTAPGCAVVQRAAHRADSADRVRDRVIRGTGTPLTEIAISPTPNAYSIMNSPGCGAGNAVATGSRHQGHRVAVLDDAAEHTRYGTGVIAESATAVAVAVSVIAGIRFATTSSSPR